MSGALTPRLLRGTRVVHKWSGIVLGLLVLVEALTGFYLLEKKKLETNVGALRVATWALPGHYRVEAREAERGFELATSIGDRVVLAGKNGLVALSDGSSTFTPFASDAAFGEVKALLTSGDEVWVAHKHGLARCSRDGACKAAHLPADTGEVRSLASEMGNLVALSHHRGPVFSHDGGATWTDEGATLRARASDDKGLKARAIALRGGRVLVATSVGLFAREPDGEWRPAGLAGRDLEDVALDATGGIWAVTKSETKERSSVLASADGGVEWRTFELAGEGPEGRTRLVATDEGVVVGSRSGVFRAGWASGVTRVAGLEALRGDVALASAGGEVLVIGADTSAHVTRDGVRSVPLAARPPVRSGVPLGKVLDDLHTGKFLPALHLVWDALAVSLAVFVLSGGYLVVGPWLVRRGRKATAPSAGALARGPRRPRAPVNVEPLTLERKNEA